MANESLTIWNAALAIVAAPRISVAGETSSSKQLVDDVWPTFRKDFAGLHPWDGCTTVAALVENTTVVKPDRWMKAWDLPSGFEQGWRLNDVPLQEAEQPLWEVMTIPGGTPVQVAFTDTTAAKLEYSFDPDSDAKLALLRGRVVGAMVKGLAVCLARPWGKKESDIGNLERDYEKALLHARVSNGRQQKRKAPRARPLVDARIV